MCCFANLHKFLTKIHSEPDYTVVPSIVIVIVAITIAATAVLLVMLYYRNKRQGIVLYHNILPLLHHHNVANVCTMEMNPAYEPGRRGRYMI